MSTRATYLVDTNILLRFLLNDQPAQSAAAQKLFYDAVAGKVTLHLSLTVITETILTLQTHYNIDRHDIGRELLKVLMSAGVKLTAPPWILEAVDFYRTTKISFADACLAAEAKAEGIIIASFDRGLDRFLAIKRHEPRL